MNLEEILYQYKGNIVRVCKMFSQHTDERKDLFQEISLQLYKSLKSFRGESSLKTFIYRISINTCVRYKYKYQIITPKIGLDEVEWYMEDESQIKMNQKEKIEQLYHCIARLNDADKSLVLLYLEDLSHQEMADISGITENHVAVKMNRIREKLFKCLTINIL